MKLKLVPLRLMAAMMASYRKGPARPELDRARLSQQRIALVKLDGIGDFILATSFLQTFRRELPQADVTFFCRQPVGELARQQFPGWSVVEIPLRQSTLTEILLDGTTRRRIKAEKPFDLLLDLRTFRDCRDAAFASWIPARQKIAFANTYPPADRWVRMPMEYRIYDQLLPLPAAEAGVPQDLQNHRTLAGWLFPQASEAGEALPQLTLDPGAREQVAAILEARFKLPPKKPFLLVCPGTSTPLKEYPAPALAKAILAVMATNPMPVLIAGSKSDERTTRPLHHLLQNRCAVIDTCGVFGLVQHAALISLSRAVLTMDSCHAHFAGVLGTPAVVILGDESRGWFAPWGESQTFRWLTHRPPGVDSHEAGIQDLPAGVIAQNLIEVLMLAETMP